MKHEEISSIKPDGTLYPYQVSNAVLRTQLDPLSYNVLREAGTERAFSGEYTDTETEGVYSCKVCDQVLFTSETKFHSGCGWPSFYAPSKDVEARCANCGSHLGHVFKGEGYDVPTDERWCINSVSLKLQPKNK